MFSTIKMCFEYYQIQLVEGDKEKTVCRTRYGSYKFLVMPFGLTNALATFYNVMNDIFREWFDDFVVIYIDDILVYNNSMEEHGASLEGVPKVERKQVGILNSRHVNLRWWKWISLGIGSPKKA